MTQFSVRDSNIHFLLLNQFELHCPSECQLSSGSCKLSARGTLVLHSCVELEEEEFRISLFTTLLHNHHPHQAV